MGVTAGGITLNFEWDPNPEPDIAGYRVFAREPGEDYDYDDPAWEGQENFCSVFVEDENEVYLFVVRAFDEDDFESDDSNEVIYEGDGEYTNEDDYVNESRYVDGGSSGSGGGCFINTIK